MKYHTAVVAALLLCASSTVTNAQPPRVVRLNLIQSGSDKVVAQLLNGTVVMLPRRTAPSFNVEAVVAGSATSVQFSHNNDISFRTDFKAPWAMCGNEGPNFNTCNRLKIGNHSVAAKVDNDGSTVYRVNFRIATAPAPRAVPVPAPVATPKDAPVQAPIVAPDAAPVVGPVPPPFIAPLSPPFTAPAVLPVPSPFVAPQNPPVRVPLAPINVAPPSVPFTAPVPAPFTAPVSVPIIAPIPAPFAAPIPAPFTAPLAPSVTAPASSPVLNNATLFQPIRINSGGGAYTDSKGQVWSADMMFVGGKLYSTSDAIANTSDPTLYRTERFGGDTFYSIPVPPGRYDVTILMSEIYFTTPFSRIFDIQVQSTTINDIDLVQIGGGSNKVAIKRKVRVEVLQGNLTIRMLTNVPKFDNPTLAGIEVTLAPPTLAPAPVPTAAPIPFEPILINCGGGTYIDTERRLWVADTYWSGGNGAITSNNEIAETDEDSLYQSYRRGESTYQIPVSGGLFEVVLYFAETFFDSEFSRIFDVSIEKTRLLGIDLVDIAGGLSNTAIRRTVSAAVFDGDLTIQFKDEINHALICAIEINRIGDAPPTNPPMISPPSQAPVAKPFDTILINCGGSRYNDTEGRLWSADRYSVGGKTRIITKMDIIDTQDDPIYWSERYGKFNYSIPVPLGNYEVVLYFAEIFFDKQGLRVFDIDFENAEELRENIDIVRDAGQAFKPYKMTVVVPVMDGFLTLAFRPKDPAINVPKISGLEIRRKGEHFAHAVIGRQYKSVDVDGDGFGVVPVDGSQSHTHGPNNVLTAYTWRIDTEIVGSGRLTNLTIPVGEHVLTLTIVDSSGSISSDETTVVVKQKGFPELFSLSPITGGVDGGTIVTLSGQDIGNATSVRFGREVVPRAAITVIDSGNITVVSPGPGVGVPVMVSVVTPIGESNALRFRFVASTKIEFAETRLLEIFKPTAAAFGPDGKLYVATQKGILSRITLNDSYDQVVSKVSNTIDENRCILGIAFDPLEPPELGDQLSVYISTSRIYHGEYRSTFGNAINGKVQKVNGAGLDNIVDVVTGLPVSEIDHSVSALYFGDNGELYIGVGSNTNAGFPGGIMGSGRQLENFFSAAILVAHVGQPTFNGQIRYDSNNNGNPIAGFGPNSVEVFANGLRNPYGITMHTNGKVYATDNGPNKAYGPTALNCSSQSGKIEGVDESDKLVLLKRGGYYGHPNHKRAQSLSDPRQCTWRSNFAPSSSADGYTAPLMRVQSSTCGIIEFESDHFGGQMRGDLILSKYNSELYRVILSEDGESINVYTDPAVPLDGNGGLAVAQAPDGSLIDVRHTDGECHLFKPIEAPSTVLDIKSVFPRRGGLAGGSKFMIFGVNFGGSPIVTVDGNLCLNVVVNSPTKITCTLPAGTVGRKDVTVTIGTASDTFVQGYRYIVGRPNIFAVRGAAE